MEKSPKTETEPTQKISVLERRPAKPEDLEFARKAHHQAYHDVVVKQFGPWNEEIQDEFFTKAWTGSPHEILSCNGEMCGYFSMEETSDSIELHELVLLPEFQGKGLGGTLLREAIDAANKKNKPVRLQVMKENRAADLYRRNGFKEVEETATHFIMEYVPTSQG
jgi:ribosomal protein S18 acetylase RimI-like enzyme